jgi:hypothetical protein
VSPAGLNDGAGVGVDRSAGSTASASGVVEQNVLFIDLMKFISWKSKSQIIFQYVLLTFLFV